MRNKINWDKVKEKALTHEEVMRRLDFTPKESEEIEIGSQVYICLMRIREIRRKLKLTQQQLSKLSGVPRETISRIESGNRNTSFETVRKLADALDYELDVVWIPRNGDSKSVARTGP